MTASSFGISFWRISRIASDCLSKALAPIEKRYGITSVQAQLLFGVRQNQDATVGLIAEKLGLARTNTSAMCKKLAGMGFLKRSRRKDDERIVSLTLTETGEEAAEAVEKRIEKLYRKLRITPGEMESLLYTFTEMSTALVDEEE